MLTSKFDNRFAGRSSVCSLVGDQKSYLIPHSWL